MIITRVARKGEKKKKKIPERRIIRNLPSVMLFKGLRYLRKVVWIKIDSSLIVRSLRLHKRRCYWKSSCKLALFGIWLNCGSPEATSSFLPATPGNPLDSTSSKHYPSGKLQSNVLHWLHANSRVKLDVDFQKSNIWDWYPFVIMNNLSNLGHYTILSDKEGLKLHSHSP